MAERKSGPERISSSSSRRRVCAHAYSACSIVSAGRLWASSMTVGRRRTSSARCRISLGMVAENRRFCRRSGRSRRTWRIAGRKPMSNMWSASSRTRTSTSRRSTSRWLARSSSRPGQATTTSGRDLSARTCAFWGTPPKTVVDRTRVYLPSFENSSWIWRASSRVGATTSARGPRRWPLPVRRCSRIGRAKAAVLPVPVCARPSTSLPSRTAGMALRWIGRASLKPSSCTPRSTWASRPKVLNSSRPPRGGPAGSRRSGSWGARSVGAWASVEGRGAEEGRPRRRERRRRRGPVGSLCMGLRGRALLGAAFVLIPTTAWERAVLGAARRPAGGWPGRKSCRAPRTAWLARSDDDGRGRGALEGRRGRPEGSPPARTLGGPGR